MDLMWSSRQVRSISTETPSHNGGLGRRTVSTGRHVIYRHSYANARFQAYTIRLTVTDLELSDRHEIEIDIVRPALQEADVSSLTWVRLTETEGAFDGIRGFAIDPEALFLLTTIWIQFAALLMGERIGWVLSDIECCGAIATRDAGEIFVASLVACILVAITVETGRFGESKFDAVI